MFQINTRLTTTAAAVLALLAAAPAIAAPAARATAPSTITSADGQTTTRVVQVGDLDLRSDAGVRMLHQRVALAASRVCGPVEMLGTPSYGSYQACVGQAAAAALARSDALVASVRGTRVYASN